MQPYEYLLDNYDEQEIAGDKDNAWILSLSQILGFTWQQHDEVPWCSEAVNVALFKTGYPVSGSAAARSFLNWGQETKTPKRGDIVVFSRPPSPTDGHVGFFIREKNGKIYTLGGNQNNGVNITPIDKARVLSYRSIPTKTSTIDKQFFSEGLSQILNAVDGMVKKLT